MSPPVILTTTSTFGIASVAERLIEAERAGVRFVHNPHGRKLSPAESLELYAMPGLCGVIAGTEAIGPPQLAGDQLRALVRCGVGMDNVDRAAAAAAGVALDCTPEAPTQAVAELALLFMLADLRGLVPHHASVAAGGWSRRVGGTLADRVVGIVGCGRIGVRTGGLAAAFGAQILGVDVRRPEGTSFQIKTLEEVLPVSDIVSLHVPPDDRPLVDRDFLARMRPGALLVNTARGSLVDEAALLEALDAGRIRYATDVFGEEPYTGPLAGHPSVIHTPHVASYTSESRERMEHEALDRLADLLDQDLGRNPLRGGEPAVAASAPALEAVFFDMDGVLLDSVDIKEAGFVATFPEADAEQAAAIRAYHREHGGMSRHLKIRHYLQRVFPDLPATEDEVAHRAERFGAIVADLVAEADEIPGASRCLAEAPCPLFVVSGTPQDELSDVIARRGWSGHFREVRGSPERKPDILRDLLARHGLDPGRCLFVGDASGDYNAAEEVGIGFVGVNVAFIPPPGVHHRPDLHGFWDFVATWRQRAARGGTRAVVG